MTATYSSCAERPSSSGSSSLRARHRTCPDTSPFPTPRATSSSSEGPSNVGGLFLNWATGLLGRATHRADPGRVPVWLPYPRGERVPIHDPDRRAVLADLDLTHDAAAIRRAAFEAAGFTVRRTIEAAARNPRRIVATGGGVRVDDWIHALADCTGLPVDCAAVPEGAALGSAYLARMAAGLETDMTDARRWARVGRRVEPDPMWTDATKERFARFLELSDQQHGAA